MNLGYLQDIEVMGDWKYNEFTPLSGKITNPDFWTKYLPVVELQIVNGIETWSCTSFGSLNLLEVLYYHQTGSKINFNDQYTAILSGTTKIGNWAKNVFQAIRYYGLIPQHALEFNGTTFDDWIDRKQITPKLIEDGREFLKEWDIYYEWVEKDTIDIFTALGSAPLGVSVAFANGKGILNPTTKVNHWVMLFNAKMGEWWEIFDHYTQATKKYDWNYKFGAVLKPSLIKKDKIMPTFKNNSLLQLSEAPGGFGLYIDGKLYIDDESKIALSFLARNSGDIKGKATGVTLEDWNKLEKFTLKGEKVS